MVVHGYCTMERRERCIYLKVLVSVCELLGERVLLSICSWAELRILYSPFYDYVTSSWLIACSIIIWL